MVEGSWHIFYLLLLLLLPPLGEGWGGDFYFGEGPGVRLLR